MNVAYYDSAYLFKAMSRESSADAVQAHAISLDAIASSQHGRVEIASICHRKVREKAATAEQVGVLLAQLSKDAAVGNIRWLPLSEKVLKRAEAVFAAAPSTLFLRAADALHLACAAENGFSDVYSNDRHFLDAAPLFGLLGINVIP